jgi:hypothetical protein
MSTADRGDDFIPTDDDKTDDLKGLPEAKDDEAKDEPKDDEAKDEPKGDEAKDEKGKPRKDSRIPLARHEAIVAKEREARQELERRLAAAEKGREVVKLGEQLTKLETDVLGMEREYNKLMAAGEVEKAADLMTKIRQTERSIVQQSAAAQIAASVAEATENARYNIALERIEEAYPQLNEDSDEFNSDLAGDVGALKETYQRRGMTPTQALQKAVKTLIGQEGRAQSTATDVNPRVTEKDVAAERRRASAAAAADAAKRTPPSLKTAGIDHDKAGGGLSPQAIMSMSQADFAKLSEDQKAKARGDTL